MVGTTIVVVVVDANVSVSVSKLLGLHSSQQSTDTMQMGHSIARLVIFYLQYKFIII